MGYFPFNYSNTWNNPTAPKLGSLKVGTTGFSRWEKRKLKDKTKILF